MPRQQFLLDAQAHDHQELWSRWEAVPGKQNIPIWLTIIVGIVAALIGTAIARFLGLADTRGFDWIELIIQIVLAAGGVILAANVYSRRSLRR